MKFSAWLENRTKTENKRHWNEHSRNKEILEVINEANLFGVQYDGVKVFFSKLADQLRSILGKGLEAIPSKAWDEIKSRLAIALKPNTSTDFMTIPEEGRATDEDVKSALKALKAMSSIHSSMKEEEIRHWLSIFNGIMRTVMKTRYVEKNGYYKAFEYFISNPQKTLYGYKPEGGWIHALSHVARALSTETRPEEIASKIVSQVASDIPEGDVIADAAKKALESMQDHEIRALVWSDRRTRKGKEVASRILAPYGIPQSALSGHTDRIPSLRKRFRDARRDKTRFRRERRG